MLVKINGKDQWKTFVSQSGLEKLGLTVSALRWLVEANGGTVVWNEDEKTAYVTTDTLDNKPIQADNNVLIIDEDGRMKFVYGKDSSLLDEYGLGGLDTSFDSEHGFDTLSQAEAGLLLMGYGQDKLLSLIKLKDDGKYYFICNFDAVNVEPQLEGERINDHIPLLKRLYFERTDMDTTFMMCNNPEPWEKITNLGNNGGYMLKAPANTEKVHIYSCHSNRMSEKFVYAILLRNNNKEKPATMRITHIDYGASSTWSDLTISAYDKFLKGTNQDEVSVGAGETIIVHQVSVPAKSGDPVFVSGNIRFNLSGSKNLEVIVTIFKDGTNINDMLGKEFTTFIGNTASDKVSGYTIGSGLITRPKIDLIEDFMLTDGRKVDFIAYETGNSIYHDESVESNNINHQLAYTTAEILPFISHENRLDRYGIEVSLGNWSITYYFYVTLDNTSGGDDKTVYYNLLTVGAATMFHMKFKVSEGGRITDTGEVLPSILGNPVSEDRVGLEEGAGNEFELLSKKPGHYGLDPEQLKIAETSSQYVKYASKKINRGMLRYQFGLGPDTLVLKHIGNETLETRLRQTVTVPSGQKVTVSFEYILGTNAGAHVYHIWSMEKNVLPNLEPHDPESEAKN